MKPGGPCRLIVFSRPHEQPQQMIKADEVIDVRVRDKDVLEALHLARRQRRDVAEIKKDGASFE